MSIEVRRPSHSHQVPHIGRPHSEPVASVRKAKPAPIGEEARAAKSASGWRQIKATALATAMATQMKRAIHAEGTWTYMMRTLSDRKSVVSGKRVSVRVDHGGVRTLKKKNKNNNRVNNT